MGKGDKKSRRGKITIGSYGVRRPKRKSAPFKASEAPVIAEPVAVKVAEAPIAPESKKKTARKPAKAKASEA